MNLKDVTNNQYLNFLSKLNGDYSFKVAKARNKVDGFDKNGVLVSRRNINAATSKGIFDDTYHVREDHLSLCVD